MEPHERRGSILGSLLAQREWLLLDGIRDRLIVPDDVAAEIWNVEFPGRINAQHLAGIEAGADIILTNTFGGNAIHLRSHEAQGRVRELNLAGAEIARNLADRAERKLAVAGMIGPATGDLSPAEAMDFSLTIEIFHEQADALKEGGADILWFDGITAPAGIEVAAAVARLTGLDWAGTMYPVAAGLGELLKSLPEYPAAFGVHSESGPSDAMRLLLKLRAENIACPLIAHARLDQPAADGGNMGLVADYGLMARDAGARIIGGRGMALAHLSAMQDALGARPRNRPPSEADIEKVLGAVSAGSG